MTWLNPDAAPQDNTSVTTGALNNGTVNAFLLHPPGTDWTLPPQFDLYRPEAFLDSTGRIQLTGYGNSLTSPVYYVVKPIPAIPFLDFLTFPTRASLAPAGRSSELPGDYTKAAIGYTSGKVLLFWSGVDNVDATRRNIDVTGIPTVIDPIPFSQKGCSAAREGRGDRGAGSAEVLSLLIPLALLRLRYLRRRRVAP
jgi:hypothetical protein